MFSTTDGGVNWKKFDARLKENEEISFSSSGFSTDRKTGFFVGNRGSVFSTTDGGVNWKKFDARLKEYEEIVLLSFDLSTDRTTGFFVGDRGSVFSTTDGGVNWKKFDARLKENEEISSSFSTNGKTGFIVGDEGSVLLSTDSGVNWIKFDAGLKEDEVIWVSPFSFSTDGKTGIIVGDRGSVFSTTDGGVNWIKFDAGLKEDEIIMFLSFSLSTDRKTGIIVGDRGSVFPTTDGGVNWKKIDAKLKDRERVKYSFFSTDQTVGIIVGSFGSVNVTWNHGMDWGYTDISEFETNSLELRDFIFCKDQMDSYAVLAFHSAGNLYQLKSYDEFAEWKNESISQWETMFQEAGEPIQSSIFFQDLRSSIKESKQIADNLIKTDIHSENVENKDKFDKSIIPFDSLTVNRIVTLTLLFFLARTLFQYAGYYLRLASFFDSRSDALLLAEDFSADKSKNFDDLVYALGPDILKFGSTPKNTVANFRSVTK